MAWSFLRGLSFEVLLERGKIVCFLDCYPSSKVPRGPPKRLIYPPHPPGTSRPGASPDRAFLILFCSSFLTDLGSRFFRSWMRPRRFLSPTWQQLGSILGVMLGTVEAFLGAALASSFKVDLQCERERDFAHGDCQPLGSALWICATPSITASESRR